MGLGKKLGAVRREHIARIGVIRGIVVPSAGYGRIIRIGEARGIIFANAGCRPNCSAPIRRFGREPVAGFNIPPFFVLTR